MGWIQMFYKKRASATDGHIFLEGLREGITMFAWWKDGVQYVGTTGAKLHDVLEEINNLEEKLKEDK